MIDQDGNFRLTASAYVVDVICPIHKTSMIKLDDGWLSEGWWCEKCQFPYKLALVKYKKWDKQATLKQLKDKKYVGKDNL